MPRVKKATSPIDSSLLEQALDGAPVGISLINRQGELLWSNQQVVDIFGYSKAELRGQLVELLIETKIRGAHIGMREHFAKHPESRPMGLGRQLYGQNKAGNLIPLEIGINVVSINSEDYFITSMTDVSKANQIRDELQQSQKMEAVARMTSNIVHDFKNSLGAISGLLEILADNQSMLTPKQKKLFSKVTDQCSATLTLANQILDASRKDQAKESNLDLNQHIQKNESLYKTLAGSTIRLTLDVPKRSLKALANPSELNQIMLNLLVNAKDAMNNKGKITIRTSTQYLQKTPRLTESRLFSGDFAVISVQDTGPGIPFKLKSSIFDPFFTTKAPGKGTGLGLSIAYEMVRKWGGFIQVESQMGEGTTFHIYLPLIQD